MSTPELVTDPVCGMLIHPTEAAGVRALGAASYHLCSLRCLEKFDADADAYVAASRVEGYRTWRATVLTNVNSAPPRDDQPR
jgi:YHS domain-containing protein